MMRQRDWGRPVASPRSWWLDAIGWYGVLAILSAYALTSFGFLAPSNLWYRLLNLTGALGIVVEAWSKRDAQPAFLNFVWALVALFALFGLGH